MKWPEDLTPVSSTRQARAMGVERLPSSDARDEFGQIRHADMLEHRRTISLC